VRETKKKPPGNKFIQVPIQQSTGKSYPAPPSNKLARLSYGCNTTLALGDLPAHPCAVPDLLCEGKRGPDTAAMKLVCNPVEI